MELPEEDILLMSPDECPGWIWANEMGEDELLADDGDDVIIIDSDDEVPRESGPGQSTWDDDDDVEEEGGEEFIDLDAEADAPPDEPEPQGPESPPRHEEQSGPQIDPPCSPIIISETRDGRYYQTTHQWDRMVDGQDEFRVWTTTYLVQTRMSDDTTIATVGTRKRPHQREIEDGSVSPRTDPRRTEDNNTNNDYNNNNDHNNNNTHSDSHTAHSRYERLPEDLWPPTIAHEVHEVRHRGVSKRTRFARVIGEDIYRVTIWPTHHSVETKKIGRGPN